MKVRLVQFAIFAIVCGLTLSVVIQNKRKRKMKKIRENKLIPTRTKVLSKSQDIAKCISLACERDNLTIPQLPVLRWIKVGKIINLHAYPLVSGKPCAADECQVKFEGMYMIKNGQLINWDRAFIVYNAETKCIITNNYFPTLYEVNLTIDDNYIILQAARMPTLSVKLSDNEIVECTYWNCEKIRSFPKIVCTDCGDDAAKWLSRFLCGKNSGLRLGYAINAVGCMGIYWQLVLRKCILCKKAKRNNLEPFLNLLHSVLISPKSYNNISEISKIFEPSKMIYPNIVILTSDFYMKEKWEWIKIGKVIIRNTQPVVEPRKNAMIADMKLLKLGVNCELYHLGRIKLDDNVYLHIPNDNMIMENQVPRKKFS